MFLTFKFVYLCFNKRNHSYYLWINILWILASHATRSSALNLEFQNSYLGVWKELYKLTITNLGQPSSFTHMTMHAELGPTTQSLIYITHNILKFPCWIVMMTLYRSKINAVSCSCSLQSHSLPHSKILSRLFKLLSHEAAQEA